MVTSTDDGIDGPRGAQMQSVNREGRPIPAMNRPEQIFDSLFVTSGKDAHSRLARSKSALDLLLANTRALKPLSYHDQQTLQPDLDAVRDTEVKPAKAQQRIDTLTADAPVPIGKVTVCYQFIADHPNKIGTGGTGRLFVGDRQVGEYKQAYGVPLRFSSYSGLDIGKVNGDVDSPNYQKTLPSRLPARFAQ